MADWKDYLPASSGGSGGNYSVSSANSSSLNSSDDLLAKMRGGSTSVNSGNFNSLFEKYSSGTKSFLTSYNAQMKKNQTQSFVDDAGKWAKAAGKQARELNSLGMQLKDFAVNNRALFNVSDDDFNTMLTYFDESEAQFHEFASSSKQNADYWDNFAQNSGMVFQDANGKNRYLPDEKNQDPYVQSYKDAVKADRREAWGSFGTALQDVDGYNLGDMLGSYFSKVDSAWDDYRESKANLTAARKNVADAQATEAANTNYQNYSVWLGTQRENNISPEAAYNIAQYHLDQAQAKYDQAFADYKNAEATQEYGIDYTGYENSADPLDWLKTDGASVDSSALTEAARELQLAQTELEYAKNYSLDPKYIIPAGSSDVVRKGAMIARELVRSNDESYAEQEGQYNETMLQGLATDELSTGSYEDYKLKGYNGTTERNVEENRISNYLLPDNRWTEDELNAWYYYLGSGNRDGADKYAKTVNNNHNYQDAWEQEKRVSEFVSKDRGNDLGDSFKEVGAGALGTAYSIAAPLIFGTGEFVGNAIEAIGTGEISQKRYLSPVEMSSAITGSISQALNYRSGTISDKVPVVGGAGLGDVYQLGTSIAQSLLAMATGGEAGSMIMFFGSAASDGIYNAIDQGIDPKLAVAYGLMQGLAECAGERFSVENFLNNTIKKAAVDGFIKSVLLQAGIEASEEAFTTLLNTVSDAFINGNRSELQLAIYSNLVKGMSYDEAGKAALKEWLNGIGRDALGGFISGGFSAGAHVVTDAAVNSGREFAGNAKDLLRMTNYVDEKYDSIGIKQYAAKLEKALAKNRSLTQYQANKLDAKIQYAAQEQDVAKISSWATDTLAEMGEVNPESKGRLIGDITAEVWNESLEGKKSFDEILQEKIDGLRNQGMTNMAVVMNAMSQSGIMNSTGSLAGASNIGTLNIRPNARASVTQQDDDGNIKLVNVAFNRFGEPEARNVVNTRQAFDSDGEQGHISNLSVKDGKVQATVNTGKGSKTSYKQVDLENAPEEIRDFYNELKDALGSDEDAVEAFNLYGNNTDIGQYINAYSAARDLYGANAVERSRIERGRGSLTAVLNDEQFEAAYNSGLKQATIKAANKVGKSSKDFKGKGRFITKPTNAQLTLNGPDGKPITLKAANREQLDAVGNNELDYVSAVTKILNYDVIVYDSEFGSMQGAFFDSGIIYLDVNAGKLSENIGERALTLTLSHEITHFIQKYAPEQYEKLKQFVVSKLVQESGKTFDDLVQDKMGRGSVKTYEDAVDEIVADGCELMLNHSEYIRELAQQNRSLWQKIKDWIDDFIAKLRSMQAHSEEAKILLPYMEEQSRIWDEALREAVQNAGNGSAEVEVQESEREIKAETPAKTESKKEKPAAVKSKLTYDDIYEADIKTTQGNELVKALMDAIERSEFTLGTVSNNGYTFNIAMNGNKASGYIQDADGNVIFNTKQRNDQTHLSRQIVNFESQKAVALELTLWAEENLRLGSSSIQFSEREVDQRVADGKAIPPDAEVQFSTRYDVKYMQNAIDLYNSNRKKGIENHVAMKDLINAQLVRMAIRDKLTDPKLQDKLRLPEDIEGDTFIADSSYGGTEENTTVCIRSLAAQALMDEVSKDLGRPLTVKDTLLISQEIMNYTDKPECLYCYVATDRRAYREYLGNYLQQREDVIKDLKSGMDRSEAYKKFLAGRKDTANMKQRFAMFERIADGGTAIQSKDLSSLEDLFKEDATTRDEIIKYVAAKEKVDPGKISFTADKRSGFKLTMTRDKKKVTLATYSSLMKDPAISAKTDRFFQLFDAMNYAQGASWAKKIKAYTAYNNHILTWSKAKVDEFNKHYGLRMYSFSDYSPAFILENMQMVTDASVKGLKMLAYTKELDFAEIFAPTGMNINISIFATELNGEIIPDEMMGAEWKRAQELRAKYPNVGITLVATNDNILKYGIAQDFVDVVIPYHLVRTGQAVADYFGYKNYTSVSGDGKIAGIKYGKKDQKSVYPSEHQNDLIRYVNRLQELNLTPRFADYLTGYEDYLNGRITEQQFRDMNPYYMKLVNETRQSAEATGTVKPVFNQEAALRSIDDMAAQGGYFRTIGNSLDVQGDIARELADKLGNGQFAERDVTKKIGQQIDDFLNGKFAQDDTFIIGSTPKIWQRIGLAALPVSINQTHVNYALTGMRKGQYDEDHHLGRSLLEQLPKAIKNPVAIIKSDSHSNDTIVVIVKLKNPINGKQVIAPVNVVGSGMSNGVQIDTNTIASFFAKTNIVKKLQDAIDQESSGLPSIYWINKKEAHAILTEAGLQLPSHPVPNGFIHSLLELGTNVNKNHSDVRYSSQFIKWFGDWTKDSKESSKIVDANGEPLVVYHGSPVKDIKEFRTKNQWGYGGLYLATNQAVAESFAGKGKVYPVYANIRNPFIIDAGYRMYDSISIESMPQEFKDSKYSFDSSTVDTQQIANWAREAGYDGVWVKNVMESGMYTDDIIAFESNEAKSIYNIGTYDSNTGNQYFSERDSTGKELSKGQMEYFKDSKARDENGNLLVLYHGTEKYGFTVFDRAKSREGFWFTENKAMADTYAFDFDNSAGTYASYLNLVNPFIMDAHEQWYSNLSRPPEMLKGYDYKEFSLEELEDEFGVMISGNDGERWDIEGDEGWLASASSLEEAVDIANKIIANGVTTDEVVMWAEKNGYDGVIIRNVYDNGGGNVELGSDYVAFSSNQIKSTDNLNPTENVDINYSLRDNPDAVIGFNINDKTQAFTEEILDGFKTIETRESKNPYAQHGSLYPYIGKRVAIVRTGKGKATVVGWVTIKEEIRYGSKDEFDSDPRHMIDPDDKKFGWHNGRAKFGYVLEDPVRETDPYVVTEKGIVVRDVDRKVQKSQFSERDNSRSDRELLADALIRMEGISDQEKAQLERYKAMAEDLDRIAEDLDGEIDRLRQLTKVDPFDKATVKQREKVNALRDKLTNADKQLLSLQSTKILNDVVMRERAKARAEAKQRATERFNERTGVNRYRKSINKSISTLENWILHNTDKEHVPEMLKAPLIEWLQTINMDSKRKVNGGEATKNDLRYAEKLGQLMKILQNQQDYMNDPEHFDGDPDVFIDLPMGFTKEIEQHIESVKSVLSGMTDIEMIPVNLMNASQLSDLDFILKVLTKSIKNINAFITESRFKGVEDAARSSIGFINELGVASPFAIDKYGRRIDSMLNWNNTLPYYAFKRFGEAGEDRFKAITDGWSRMAFNVRQALNYAEHAYTSKEAKEWEDELHVIEIDRPGAEGSTDPADKVTISMTTAQIMSLYCLSQREQAYNHLMGGGMRIGNIESGKGHKAIQQIKSVTLTPATLKQITDTLTARQMQVAMDLKRFMNTTCSAWGNEVSMARFGYRAFTETDYFPITTDDNLRPQVDPEQKKNDFFRLLNLSATKALTPRANNAIVISSIFDVFADHTADMAKYNALALPVLDIMKWYNFNDKQVDFVDEGASQRKKITTDSVHASVEQSYGNQAKRYIMNFIRDLNGVKEGGRNEEFLKGFVGKYKSAAVAANVRVALQQPTSIARALLTLDAKHILKGIAMANGVNEAMEWSGLAVWKDLGYFDTNVARNMRDQIKHTESTADMIRDRSMILAEMGDKLTWGAIWNACKLDVREKQPELKGDDLMQAVADRFNEVILSTQVIDSTISRSDMMRSTTLGVGDFTAFMSEPTVTYNALLNVRTQISLDERRLINKGKDKKVARAEALKKNAKLANKTIAVYVFSTILTQMAASIGDMARDDDDYETLLQKWYSHFLDNMKENIAPWNTVPFVSSLIDVLTGGSKENLATSGLKQVYTAYKICEEYFLLATGKIEDPTSVTYYGNMTAYGAAYKCLQALSSMTGIAFASAMREAVALYNMTIGLFTGKRIKTYDPGKKKEIQNAYNNKFLSDEEAVQYLLEADPELDPDDAYWMVEGWKDGTGKYDQLFDAILSGDTKAIGSEMLQLTSHGVKERSMQQSIANKIYDWYSGEEQKITKQEAIDYLVKYAGKDKDTATAKVQQLTCKVVTGIDYNDIQDLYMDYVNGDKDGLTATKAQNMLQLYGGLDAQEALDKVNSWTLQAKTGIVLGSTGGNSVKDAVVSGKITYQQAVDYLIKYGGNSPQKAEEYAKQYMFTKATGYNWSDRTSAYINGDVSKEQMKAYLIDINGVTEKSANSSIKTMEKKKTYSEQFMRETGYSWKDREKAYSAGKVSRDQLVSYFRNINGQSKANAEESVAEIEWEMSRPKAAAAAPTVTGYTPTAARSSQYTDSKGRYTGTPAQTEDIVYSRLSQGLGGDKKIVAAIMGNMKHESGFTTYRYENDMDSGSNYATSRKFIDNVMDRMAKGEDMENYFTNNAAIPGWGGYGLIQVTNLNLRNWLYNYAVDTNRNLDDPEMQADYVVYLLKGYYNNTYKKMQEAKTVEEAAEIFRAEVEQSETTSAGKRQKYAADYYNRYT